MVCVSVVEGETNESSITVISCGFPPMIVDLQPSVLPDDAQMKSDGQHVATVSETEPAVLPVIQPVV